MSFSYESNFPYSSFEIISDSVNKWHGVFLNKEEAEKYLEERKIAYKTDPDLIEEVIEARSFIDSIDNTLSEIIE